MSDFSIPIRLFNEPWARKDPQRLLWFADLLQMAATQDGTTMTCGGETCEVSRGEVLITYADLSKKWGVDRAVVRRFILKLVEIGELAHGKRTGSARITICKYDSYEGGAHGLRTATAQKPSKNGSAHGKRTGSARITDSNSTSYEGVAHGLRTATAQEQEEKRKEESAPPTPPTKEENKKEEDANAELSLSLTERLVHPVCAHTQEGESSASISHEAEEKTTPQPPAKEKKSRKKKPKDFTLIHKARLIVEEVFKELYDGASYYWQPKDAMNMKQLLQKIAFSRQNRETPLPVDDDSLLDALRSLLNAIDKEWIARNFSVPQINQHYNEIISEIKRNQGYGKQSVIPASAGRNKVESNAESASARQKQDVVDVFAEAQRRWEEEQRGRE